MGEGVSSCFLMMLFVVTGIGFTSVQSIPNIGENHSGGGDGRGWKWGVWGAGGGGGEGVLAECHRVK